MSRFLRGLLIAGVVLLLVGGMVVEIRNHLPLTTPAFDGVVDSGSGGNIPAINQPRFDTVKVADAYLSDDGLGIDFAVGSTHRFYPYQILVWHEVVNDEINGTPIVVTYDPLCGSGMVFDRTYNGTTYTFSVADKVKNNNLLMQDGQSDDLWSQIGDTRLNYWASTVESWKTFKAEHPDGEVLSRSTGAIRDYTSNPYGDYATSDTIYFPLTTLDGTRPPKEIVVGERGEQMYWFCWAAFHPGQEPVSSL